MNIFSMKLWEKEMFTYKGEEVILLQMKIILEQENERWAGGSFKEYLGAPI